MPKATLLLAAQCEQAILPTVYEFLSRYDISPVDTQEYCIAAGRFARLEWPINENLVSTEQFELTFNDIAKASNFEYRVAYSDSAYRVGLFCPTNNDCLEHILQKYSPLSGDAMQIAFVIGDKEGLELAANRYGVPYFCVEADDGVAREAQFLQLISRYKPDLFAMMPRSDNFSAGLLKKLPCSVLAVSEARVPSNAPGLVLDAGLAGAGVLLASAFLLEGDVNRPQLVVQQAQPLTQKSEFAQLYSEQEILEYQVLVAALSKFAYNKVIAYKHYLYAFD